VGRKRKTWEEAVKLKEEERVRLHSNFQREARVLAARTGATPSGYLPPPGAGGGKTDRLKAQVTKEAQAWQELTQSRDEQLSN